MVDKVSKRKCCVNIVQFSDFHFGNNDSTFNWKSFAMSLGFYLKKKVENPLLIISGDITFKGYSKGYVEAIKFFECLIDNGVTERSRILMCPGNHDIVNKSFREFDAFSYKLRRDSKFLFQERSHQEFLIDGCLFKFFNSSYHMDHSYGLIEKSAMTTEHKNHDGLKIAVMHHHLLNMFKDDTSAVRNAYDLYKYLDIEGFNYLLHGHQHSEQSYCMGRSHMKVISARSGNYHQKGFLNSVNLYQINDVIFEGMVLVPEKSTSEIKIREMAL